MGSQFHQEWTPRNIVQMFLSPAWAMGQLMAGKPEFQTMKPYIPKGLSMKHLGLFMNKTFSGRLTESKIAPIREKWQGNLVVKGIVNPEDAEIAVKHGLDGLIVSNHGGRQLDRGQSTIVPMSKLVPEFADKLKVMIDGGMYSGADIAACLACGANFAFMGRTPCWACVPLDSMAAITRLRCSKNNCNRSWSKSVARKQLNCRHT